MKYLPSRKFLKTVAFLLFLGAVSFMVFGSKSIILTRNSPPQGTLVVKNESSSYSKDSDGDGLPDWEERLLGTDPFKKDSGGNGVPDGVAYKTQKLYPDIEIPPDLLQEFLNFNGRIASAGSGGTLNITDALSKETSLRYGALGQGKELPKKTFDQLGNALAADFSQFVPKDIYTPGDVRMISRDGPQEINVYIASVVAILNENESVYEKNALVIERQFLETGDETLGSELENLETSFSAITKSLLALKTPESVVATHLTLLNASNHVAQALKDMGAGKSDPVRALQGGAAFIHYSEEKQKAVTELVALFKKYNQ